MYFNKSDRATDTNDVGFLVDFREGGKAFHRRHPRKAKDFLPNSDLTLGTVCLQLLLTVYYVDGHAYFEQREKPGTCPNL